MSKEIEVVDIETKKVEETKQNTQDSKQVKIQVLTLGEIVVKFEMPQNFIDEINNVFDENIDDGAVFEGKALNFLGLQVFVSGSVNPKLSGPSAWPSIQFT